MKAKNVYQLSQTRQRKRRGKLSGNIEGRMSGNTHIRSSIGMCAHLILYPMHEYLLHSIKLGCWIGTRFLYLERELVGTMLSDLERDFMK